MKTKSERFINVGAFGGSLFLTLVALLVVLGVGAKIFGYAYEDKKFEEWKTIAHENCFNKGGRFDHWREKVRCIHTDGRVEINQWQSVRD